MEQFRKLYPPKEGDFTEVFCDDCAGLLLKAEGKLYVNDERVNGGCINVEIRCPVCETIMNLTIMSLIKK